MGSSQTKSWNLHYKHQNAFSVNLNLTCSLSCLEYNYDYSHTLNHGITITTSLPITISPSLGGRWN